MDSVDGTKSCDASEREKSKRFHCSVSLMMRFINTPTFQFCGAVSIEIFILVIHKKNFLP